MTVDFAGTIDGQPFEGGQGKGIAIVVGSGQVLQDFDRALRGTAAGESATATVLFPQDYPTKNLAGKTAVFAIDVQKVEERQLPPLDDEFAASFGLAGGAGALRGEVRNNMERELKERLRAETKTRVFDALIAANRITVPRALVDQEIDALQAQALRQMGSSDASQAPARERFEAIGSAARDGRALDPRARSRAQDQARSSARRATHQGARGALREARGSRAVLSQRSWHDGSGRSVRARGSSRRFPARRRRTVRRRA